MNDIVNMENIGENLICSLKISSLVLALFFAQVSGNIVQNGGFEAGKQSYPPSKKGMKLWNMDDYMEKKKSFWKLDLPELLPIRQVSLAL